jgi:hypothetical protein
MSLPRPIAWAWACAAWLAPGPPAAALTVAPTVIEARAAAGGTIEGRFTVANETAAPTDIRVELEPLSPTAYGAQSPAAWLRMNPERFALGPGQSVEVAYAAAVPAAAQGELAAEIIFVQDPPAGGGIQVRFGVALYVSVAGTERLRLEPGPMSLHPGTPATIRLTLGNGGNVHCRPEGRVSVRDAAGRSAGQGILARGMPALPGRADAFTVALAGGPLGPGAYRLTADLTCPATAGPPLALQIEQSGRLDEDLHWLADDSSRP